MSLFYKIAGIALTGGAFFTFAPYVTLQPTPTGGVDKGHINVSGEITAGSGFNGDGSNLKNVMASGLALPIKASTRFDGLAFEITNAAPLGYGFGYAIKGNGDVIGVEGTAASDGGFGVVGSASGWVTTGVQGNNANPYYGIGVAGVADGNMSVGVNGVGVGEYSWGVAGSGGANGAGVYAFGNGDGPAIYAQGNIYGTGTKSFQIDDPTDPANRTITHYCAEGAEPLNVYSGNVRTDGKGYAEVALPAYFASINRDPRYQLTVIDERNSTQFALAKVVPTTHEDRFAIRTSVPNTLVSWRVEAVRDDPWVQKYGAPVVQEKLGSRRGRYLEPGLYGKSKDLAIANRLAILQPQAKRSNASR